LDRAKGPAVTVGAAAVGVAGGLALHGRLRRRRVLGFSMPRSRDLDLRSVAKGLGDASLRLAELSRSASRDIERAGEGAERIGRILR
jgi:hypothetical protein